MIAAGVLSLSVFMHIRLADKSKASSPPQRLISVLRNKRAPFGDRDDAAMDLGADSGDDVEDALLSVVTDHTEDGELVESAAESLAGIWNRSSSRKEDYVVRSMHPAARRFFVRQA